MNRYALLICTLAFFIEQNSYFGWHRFPTSDAELIADGICLLMIGLGFRSLQKGEADD
jgi:hypothetical protein